MTAKAFLKSANQLPAAPLTRIIGHGGVVVVAPHPDDETLGCGGLIALAHDEGRAVRVIVVSDGCGSHPNSRSHPQEILRELREQETRAAVAELGLEDDKITFLRLPDRYVPHDGEAAEGAARAIATAVCEIGASALLATWRHDPHCDHQATWRIAEMAMHLSPPHVSLVAYPIWAWTLPPHTPLPFGPKGWRLAIEKVLSHKRRAIAAHRSQISNLVENDPPVLILTEQTRARFEDVYEIYLEVEP